MSPVSGFRLLPMQLDKLDRAVELRKQSAAGKSSSSSMNSNNLGGGGDDTNGVKSTFAEAQAESSYLLLQGGGIASSSESEYQRTGRWTDEEVFYTDFLVEAFDSGSLPVEHGMKLSDFLSEVLLCKSSRLTKKMKNAKLSVRSYEFRYPLIALDTKTLSQLELKFLESITSEPSRLELSFNLTRLWRSHLSNLCLQVGSSLLDASDWIASLEDMETRATQAEDRIRKARRKRMGLALRKDMKGEKDGVFFSGVPVQRPQQTVRPYKRVKSIDETNAVASGSSQTENSSAHSLDSSDGGEELDFIQDMLDLGDDHPRQVDDYARILDDLMHGPGLPPGSSSAANNNARGNHCGPFLDEIIAYAENNNLPFHHVDVWVPSFTKTEGNEELRLYHAGYATRTDVESALFGQMNEYGEYSTKFSFASGVGLPGRVFATGGPRWERGCHEADPKYFERAGGAKVYGVKTGFGFPLSTKVIGRIILCFYSVEDVPEDPMLVSNVTTDLSKLCPEPKWKLVVDIDGESSTKSVRSYGSSNRSVNHHNHSSTRFRSDDTSVNSGSTRQDMSIDGDVITDHRIATLLGDHMPLAELPAPGESTCSSAQPSLLVPHFMSLRLLLLRSPDRRSATENDMIDVIRKSFVGYTRDGRRSDKELANLIVKDWQFLKASQPTPMKSSLSEENPKRLLKRSSSVHSASSAHASPPYQSHVMDIPMPSPTIQPSQEPPDFGPMTQPHPLSFMDPKNVHRGSFSH
eukprot:scaffold6007_cov183-Amphora_coffeaeformis.AAC.25